MSSGGTPNRVARFGKLRPKRGVSDRGKVSVVSGIAARS
jgi:hypothetical protein